LSNGVDRRAVFCLLAAGLCLLLIPVTPAEYRLVGVGLAVAYLALGAASYLDFRSRTRGS
jgi:hypothetical protein